MLCFVPVLRGCVGYVCCQVRKNALLRCLYYYYVFVGLWDGTMLANFHMCGVMLVKAVFNMLMRNASPRGPMCFRCLMFSFVNNNNIYLKSNIQCI